MGKRKNRPDLNKTPPSEVKTYSSRMDLQWREKSTRPMDRHTHKSLASIIDTVDCNAKQPISYHSHHNHNRPIFQKKPHNFNGYHYSRRKSSNNVKGYEKVWLKKVTPQNDIDSSRRKENKERAFCRQERASTSAIVVDATSAEEAVRIVCGLCERALQRKPRIFGNTISSDLSVIAVLVCGHVYHADCLERKTHHEDICDPICPISECTYWK